MPKAPPKSATLRLTEELIGRASVSPNDGGCQALMTERLAAIVQVLHLGRVLLRLVERHVGELARP